MNDVSSSAPASPLSPTPPSSLSSCNVGFQDVSDDRKKEAGELKAEANKAFTSMQIFIRAMTHALIVWIAR